MTEEEFFIEFGRDCCRDCPLADSTDCYKYSNPLVSNCWWNSEGTIPHFTTPCAKRELAKTVPGGILYLREQNKKPWVKYPHGY